jgi:hypothetical protein
MVTIENLPATDKALHMTSATLLGVYEPSITLLALGSRSKSSLLYKLKLPPVFLKPFVVQMRHGLQWNKEISNTANAFAARCD